MICSVCGVNKATKLCDYIVGQVESVKQTLNETCDESLCVSCSLHIGGDYDFCPDHAETIKKELLMYGGASIEDNFKVPLAK
ncbi:hypothetical protein KC480_05575 [Bacillus velezensis]|uniref:hypothetical protein n=1 Tax=Bacillus velezensis TaxID=492670 RepID=UPI001E28DA89|nr:hypothetical protein [Bacillus velezensis]MCD7910993.1 hypothetical protein [Bacillus velezensis]